MPPDADVAAPGARASRPLETAPEAHATPHRGWHSRGYLPHFDGAAVIQSVTWRLADAIPASSRPRVEAISDTEHRRRLDAMLDAGHGACVLRQPAVARIMVDALHHDADGRYRLHAWVVMPNHVHVLVQGAAGVALDRIVQSWKSYTAKAINRHLGRTGTLWMADYWDRYIRDAEHFQRCSEYIIGNPVRAGLVWTAEDWPWSSAARKNSAAAGAAETDFERSRSALREPIGDRTVASGRDARAPGGA